MGKGILIIVLGLGIITSLLILDLNANTEQNLDSTIEFYKETQVRLIANSGVEIILEKLRRDKTLKGNFLNNELLTGEYDAYIYGVDSALTIKVVARYMDKVHISKVNARRRLVQLPPINSSIYVSSQNLGLNLNGNVDINGNDHNMDGTVGPSVSLPGIALDNSADSAFVINELKAKIENQILGLGGAPSVRTVLDLNNWKEITENYIFAADITLPSGTYSSGTVLGTLSEPKITYVSGNVHFSGSASGYGIMIINGNVELSGNFTFKGIVIAYGQSTIETKTVGNAGIFGAAIFVGQSVSIQATGNAQFYYSSQAVSNAKNNLKSSRFEILNWWE